MKKNSFSVIDTKRTAERIKCMMEWKHFRPRDIQEYLGLACVQTVYHWLSGAAIPNIDHLYALSQLFQVKIDDILIGERKPLPISRSQAYYLMEYYKRLTRLEIRNTSANRPNTSWISIDTMTVKTNCEALPGYFCLLETDTRQ